MTTFLRRSSLAVFYAFMLAPMIVIVIVSLGAGSSMEFPPRSLSLEWYRKALTSRDFIWPLLNSTILALATAGVSAMLGIVTALALMRSRSKLRTFAEMLVLSPLIVPGVVLGIALLITFAEFGLRNSWIRLFLAHVLITFPYCVRTTMVSLSKLDPAYNEAAETLGASPLTCLLEVTLPLIRPGVIAGVLFAFVVSFDNVPTTIFLTDHNTTTLPIAIMSFIQYDFNPSVASISSLLIIAMVVLSIAIDRLFGLRRMFAA